MASVDVYPDPNPESTSVDGEAYTDWIDGFTNCRNYTGDYANATSGTMLARTQNVYTTYYVIHRMFMLFDTSAIGSGNTVTAASIFLYRTNINSGNARLRIVSSNPASNTDIVAGDYDSRGTTSFGYIDGVVVNQYNEFVLNASGIANINPTGISKFAGITNADYSGTFVAEYVQVRSADNSGTSEDPYLHVVYSPPGPSGVASWDTVASANVSSLNTVAWGSISSIQ